MAGNPVRDLLGAVLWLGSYLSAKIDWRGETYRLSSGGLMLRTHSREANTKIPKGKTKTREDEICDLKTFPS